MAGLKIHDELETSGTKDSGFACTEWLRSLVSWFVVAFASLPDGDCGGLTQNRAKNEGKCVNFWIADHCWAGHIFDWVIKRYNR